jgi:hypothetical protein
MAKVKKGDVLRCGVCGLAVVIDEACGCGAATEILCCSKPMAKGKKAAAAAKAPAKVAAKKAAPAKKPAAKKAAPAKAVAKKAAPAKKPAAKKAAPAKAKK